MPEEVVSHYTIEMEQHSDFEFHVRFGPDWPELTMDDAEPIGHGRGPGAGHVLAAAVGNCLSASLLFCARKAKVEIGRIHTKVHVNIGRNDRGRLRIIGLDVDINPQIQDAERARALRCIDLFEDYCTVTASIRDGIPVQVSVQGFEK